MQRNDPFAVLERQGNLTDVDVAVQFQGILAVVRAKEIPARPRSYGKQYGGSGNQLLLHVWVPWSAQEMSKSNSN